MRNSLLTASPQRCTLFEDCIIWEEVILWACYNSANDYVNIASLGKGGTRHYPPGQRLWHFGSSNIMRAFCMNIVFQKRAHLVVSNIILVNPVRPKYLGPVLVVGFVWVGSYSTCAAFPEKHLAANLTSGIRRDNSPRMPNQYVNQISHVG